jgi:predicted DNA-binding transcriptional regulator YafY
VNAHAATWISREQWHPDQTGQWLDDGSYELRVPYTSETELAMDILRHGANVEVLEPPSLRSLIAERVGQVQALYAVK